MQDYEIKLSDLMFYALINKKRFGKAANKAKELIDKDQPVWVYWVNGSQVCVSKKPIYKKDQLFVTQ